MLIIARTDFWLLALVLSSAWLLTEYTLAAPAGRPRLSDATLSDTSPAPPPPLSITSSAELCHILANHLDATACARLARVWPDFRETVLHAHRMTDTHRGAAGKVVTASDSQPQTISTLFNEINVITAADGLWKALDRLWYMSRGTEEQSSKFHQQIAVRLSYHHRALLSWRESSPRSISEIFHGMETAVTAIAALENFFFAEEDAAACEEYLAARFPESVHMSGTICCGPALYTKWRHVWKLVRRDLEGPTAEHYHHITRMQRDVHCMRSFLVRILDNTFGPLGVMTRVRRIGKLLPLMRTWHYLGCENVHRNAFGSYVQWKDLPYRPRCPDVDDWILPEFRSMGLPACPAIFIDIRYFIERLANIDRRVFLVHRYGVGRNMRQLAVFIRVFMNKFEEHFFSMTWVSKFMVLFMFTALAVLNLSRFVIFGLLTVMFLDMLLHVQTARSVSALLPWPPEIE